MKKLVVGARGSALSRAQTMGVIDSLGHAHPGLEIEFREVTTSGDADRKSAFPVGMVGFFTKEIERVLLDGEVDLAVHSLKDLPVVMAEGLELAAVPQREDHRDALVTREGAAFEELVRGATVGTTSPRRIAQILARRPDLETAPLRGNLDTRLGKLDAGDYDAIVVAAAGMKRLGLSMEKTSPLEFMLPAAAQGALAVQARSGDREVLEIASVLNHEHTETSVTAERELLRFLDAGCRAPVGVYAAVNGGFVKLEAAVISLDGKKVCRASAESTFDRPGDAAALAYEELVRLGAAEIVKESRDLE